MDIEGGQEQEGEMYGESNMEIDSQWEFAIWLRQLKQGLCDNLEGWDVEADGREVCEGGDMDVPMDESCWCLTEKNKIL